MKYSHEIDYGRFVMRIQVPSLGSSVNWYSCVYIDDKNGLLFLAMELGKTLSHIRFGSNGGHSKVIKCLKHDKSHI